MKSGQKMLIALMSVLAILTACGDKGKETAGRKAAPHPSGYTVSVSEEGQKADGITIIPLKAGLYQQKAAAYGEVLAPEGLSELLNNYTAATSALEKAKARLKASEAEYDRLKMLNADDKNVSDKELQSAAARFRADRAEEAAASGTLTSSKNIISLKWGRVISGWVTGYEPPLRRILESRDVLVQITLQPSCPMKRIPERILLTTPAGTSVSARFVSRATNTNPVLQGLSFIYISSSRNGRLVPGMSVTAQMASTLVQTGFLIPASAVVWLQDKAWVYVKKSETGFFRIEVPTSTPVDSGYFVSGIFAGGDQVVTRGAQALLSAESTPEATGGEEEDED